jgi:hypothetical protein
MTSKKFKLVSAPMNGGSLDLSGPTVIGYFSNKLINKKIIILGDIHGDMQGSCPEDKGNITQYIDGLKNKKMVIDLFLEAAIQEKIKLKLINLNELKMKQNDHITELINYGYDNYKKHKNLRVHFIEIRSDLNKPQIRSAITEFRETGMNVINLLKLIKTLKVDVDLMKIFDKFSNNFDNFLFSIFLMLRDRTINPQLIQFSSELFLKGINKLYEYNQDFFAKIRSVAFEVMNNYLETRFNSNFKLLVNKDDTKMLEEKIQILNDLYIRGFTAGAIANDIYVLSRILKSKEFNGCIIYVGRSHYDFIKRCLLEINFLLEKELSAQEPDFRCIKNVIPFETFFEN